jgi:FixJ family two-component response regulator
MQGVLIADDNLESCKQMADLFAGAGYEVTVTNSAATVLLEALKKTAQVVLIGNDFDEVAAADLIPLLKKCNRELSIIFVSSDASLSLVRKLRNDGIFYHALPPEEPKGQQELKQAVECALETHRNQYIH